MSRDLKTTPTWKIEKTDIEKWFTEDFGEYENWLAEQTQDPLGQMEGIRKTLESLSNNTNRFDWAGFLGHTAINNFIAEAVRLYQQKILLVSDPEAASEEISDFLSCLDTLLDLYPPPKNTPSAQPITDCPIDLLLRNTLTLLADAEQAEGDELILCERLNPATVFSLLGKLQARKLLSIERLADCMQTIGWLDQSHFFISSTDEGFSLKKDWEKWQQQTEILVRSAKLTPANASKLLAGFSALASSANFVALQTESVNALLTGLLQKPTDMEAISKGLSHLEALIEQMQVEDSQALDVSLLDRLLNRVADEKAEHSIATQVKITRQLSQIHSAVSTSCPNPKPIRSSTLTRALTRVLDSDHKQVEWSGQMAQTLVSLAYMQQDGGNQDDDTALKEKVRQAAAALNQKEIADDMSLPDIARTLHALVLGRWLGLPANHLVDAFLEKLSEESRRPTLPSQALIACAHQVADYLRATDQLLPDSITDMLKPPAIDREGLQHLVFEAIRRDPWFQARYCDFREEHRIGEAKRNFIYSDIVFTPKKSKQVVVREIDGSTHKKSKAKDQRYAKYVQDLKNHQGEPLVSSFDRVPVKFQSTLEHTVASMVAKIRDSLSAPLVAKPKKVEIKTKPVSTPVDPLPVESPIPPPPLPKPSLPTISPSEGDEKKLLPTSREYATTVQGLLDAISDNHLTAVNKLIGSGVLKKATPTDKADLLIHALNHGGDRSMITRLKQQLGQPIITTPDKTGKSPLQYAVESDHEIAVRVFMPEHGFKKLSQTAPEPYAIWQQALQTAKPPIVKLLTQAGLTLPDTPQESPLPKSKTLAAELKDKDEGEYQDYRDILLKQVEADAKQESAGAQYVRNVVGSPQAHYTSLLKDEQSYSYLQKIREQVYSAAENGSASAQFLWAQTYLDKNNNVSNEPEFLYWLKLSAAQHYPSAQATLGGYYLLKRDKTLAGEAVRLLRSAAEKNSHVGLVNLASCYHIGFGVSENISEAIKYYRLAIRQGSPQACHSLGIIYLTGEHVPKNPKKAMKLFRVAAKQGIREAQYRLALFYSSGAGGVKDEKKAGHWMKKSADQGHPAAQYALGDLNISNCEHVDDILPAFRLLQASAKQGDEKAIKFLKERADHINELAQAYEIGKKIEDQEIAKDPRKALELYELFITYGDNKTPAFKQALSACKKLKSPQTATLSTAARTGSPIYSTTTPSVPPLSSSATAKAQSGKKKKSKNKQKKQQNLRN